MYDTEKRIELVKKRMYEYHRRQERRTVCRLSVLCTPVSYTHLDVYKRQILIYATSNRRHLVREKSSDKLEIMDDDDLHSSDTCLLYTSRCV